MIFADKLIELRKKAHWTQEELAEKMDVSRQSIAKWEGAQSIPELSKIVKLSELFGVSTDYLLKDEIETEEHISEGSDGKGLRRVSMEEANGFLDARKKASGKIALGTFLCILSPVCLIFLGAMSENPVYRLSENTAAGIGLCVLLVMVAAAVSLFVTTANGSSAYEYLEKEIIETEYGVDGMVREHMARFKPTYDKCNLLGTVICILSVLPLFIGIIMDENNDLLMVMSVCILLALVGIGVMFFVRVGVVWASYEKLLQSGEYSKEKKKEQNSVIGAVSSAYWLIVTAVYLAYSFSTENWKVSWIVWAVAGVLYPALTEILRSFVKKEK